MISFLTETVVTGNGIACRPNREIRLSRKFAINTLMFTRLEYSNYLVPISYQLAVSRYHWRLWQVEIINLLRVYSAGSDYYAAVSPNKKFRLFIWINLFIQHLSCEHSLLRLLPLNFFVGGYSKFLLTLCQQFHQYDWLNS